MRGALVALPDRTALVRAAAAWPAVPRRKLSPELVLEWIRKLAGCCYQDCEIATAISDAACASPLWDDEAGPHRTAALLVALALTVSNLHPNLVGVEGGFGVFQIRVPRPDIDATVLLVPRTAAHVAIEMLRQALEMPGEMTLAERLVWYPEAPSAREAWCASERILLTNQLLQAG